MLESLFSSQTHNTAQTERVLTYVKNERMGGYVPKYETRAISPPTIDQTIENSMNGSQGQDLLSYQSPSSTNNGNDEQFGFSDLIDMVNPLHHIPVVGHLYREITGDSIKPIAKIVGGATFGGPLGVASALIDTVVIAETGSDMGGNAYDMAFNRNVETPASNQQAALQSSSESLIESPVESIEKAIDSINDSDMTSALLSYSDLSVKSDNALKYEAYQRAEIAMERGASQREAITTLTPSRQRGIYNL